MQVCLKRVVPRVALSWRPTIGAQLSRSFVNQSQQQQQQGNQLQHREGKKNDVAHRRDGGDFVGFKDNMESLFNDWTGNWTPFGFNDIDGLRDQMFREIDRFDRDYNRNVPAWRAKSYVSETKEGDVMITVDMPGLSKEDVSVDLKGGVLTIKGAKKEEKQDENNYSKRKLSFFKTFHLPEDIDPASIKAKVEHGVLEITIPKPKEVEQPSATIAIQ